MDRDHFGQSVQIAFGHPYRWRLLDGPPIESSARHVKSKDPTLVCIRIG